MKKKYSENSDENFILCMMRHFQIENFQFLNFLFGNSILAFNLFRKNHFRHSKLGMKHWRCPNNIEADCYCQKIAQIDRLMTDSRQQFTMSVPQRDLEIKKSRSYHSINLIQCRGLSWPFWQSPKVTKTCQSDIQKSRPVESTETRMPEFDLTHVLW